MTTLKAEKTAKNSGVCRRSQGIKRAGDQKKPSAQNFAKKLYFSFWKIVLFFLAIIDTKTTLLLNHFIDMAVQGYGWLAA